MSDITFITDKLIQASKLIELNILRQNIEMQIAEAELLQAMYPSEQEFKLNDMTILENFRQWLDLDNQDLPELPENSLSFVLTLEDFELHVQSQLSCLLKPRIILSSCLQNAMLAACGVKLFQN